MADATFVVRNTFLELLDVSGRRGGRVRSRSEPPPYSRMEPLQDLRHKVNLSLPGSACVSGDGSSSEGTRQEAGDFEDGWAGRDITTLTTVIMWNLPAPFTRDDVVELLNSHSFYGQYNFIYMPLKFSSGSAFGYASINFDEHANAVRFQEYFLDFSNWSQPFDNVTSVSWSNSHQGLTANVERYRNSRLMDPTTPDLCKPIVLQHGVRAAFPAPTPRRQRLEGKERAVWAADGLPGESAGNKIVPVLSGHGVGPKQFLGKANDRRQHHRGRGGRKSAHKIMGPSSCDSEFDAGLVPVNDAVDQLQWSPQTRRGARRPLGGARRADEEVVPGALGTALLEPELLAGFHRPTGDRDAGKDARLRLKHPPSHASLVPQRQEPQRHEPPRQVPPRQEQLRQEPQRQEPQRQMYNVNFIDLTTRVMDQLRRSHQPAQQPLGSTRHASKVQQWSGMIYVPVPTYICYAK